MCAMKLEFDLAKNEVNLVKHGVPLVQAEHLDWDTLVGIPDNRRDSGELRIIGYALMGERLHCVVFADRNGVRRIISLRKANGREVNLYAQNN